MTNEIIVLCGPSACGKDTVARFLEKYCGYNFVISTTTRPIRPGESQGNPYHFVKNNIFENLINNGELIEYRKYETLVDNKPDTWYYGVENAEIKPDNKYICVLDTVGLKEFKNKFGDRVVSFYLNVDADIRKKRCQLRGDFNESEWDRRLADDKIRFSIEIIEELIDFFIEADKDTELIVDEINYHLLNHC